MTDVLPVLPRQLTTISDEVRAVPAPPIPVLADPSQQAEADTVGVLGAVPLELMHPGDIEWISQSLVEDGWQIGRAHV